jgi:hypothetical protein
MVMVSIEFIGEWGKRDGEKTDLGQGIGSSALAVKDQYERINALPYFNFFL